MNRRCAARRRTSASASDPLAELARLIGQNDPFAEFGRDNARAVPPAADRRRPPTAPSFGANDYFGAAAAPAPQPCAGSEAAPFGARGLAAACAFAANSRSLSVPKARRPAYPAADAGELRGGPRSSEQRQFGAEEDDFYDDAPPPRRRMGVMAIAAVFALAVIGTAGAFGYRALFGSSGTHVPPPVIKADTAPSKIVPATASKDRSRTS